MKGGYSVSATARYVLIGIDVMMVWWSATGGLQVEHLLRVHCCRGITELLAAG